MTCPCGEYDYIGSTTNSLFERSSRMYIYRCMDTCIFLFNLEHREEGHRIIREFLLGPVNIKTILDQDKRKHEFVHSRLYISLYVFLYSI